MGDAIAHAQKAIGGNGTVTNSVLGPENGFLVYTVTITIGNGN